MHPGVNATVTCTAQVRSKSLGEDDRHFTLVDGSVEFADRTLHVPVPAFTLYVNQWKSDGSLCHGENTELIRKRMLYTTHHVYVPLNLKYEIKTDPGCIPRFTAYVELDHLAEYNGGPRGNRAPARSSTCSCLFVQ
ncbi:hypothetical protein [Crossiella sp. CA198]|uniref:hypothetical protein n=1 Tax=Crossiella sp. CA198 TaxID=3455607 RepID=UPI003F8D2194